MFLLKFIFKKEYLQLNYNIGQFDNKFDDYGVFNGSYSLSTLDFFVRKEDNKKKKSLLLPTNSSIPFIISKKLNDELIESGVSGIDNYKARILDEEGNIINEEYCGFLIKGRINDKPDWGKSAIIPDKTFTQIHYYKGLFYNIDKWDGSDIFLEQDNSGVVDNSRVLITTKVYEILRKKEIKNIELIPLSECLFNKNTIDFIAS